MPTYGSTSNPQSRRTGTNENVFVDSETSSQASANDSGKQSWIATLKSYVQLELENTGSVARDHLASERTWLGYVRTSLAIASSGVALVQLFSLDILKEKKSVVYLSKPLGAASVLIAIFLLAVGIFRYFSIQSALIRGYFAPAGWIVWVITGLMGTITAIIFALLVSTIPN